VSTGVKRIVPRVNPAESLKPRLVLNPLQAAQIESELVAKSGDYQAGAMRLTVAIALGLAQLPRPSLKAYEQHVLEGEADASELGRQHAVATALYQRGLLLHGLSLWTLAAEDFS